MTPWHQEEHPDLEEQRRTRRAPNGGEKTAAALLKIKIGAVGGRWLIPEPLRSEGTPKEICAAVEWDHIRRHAEGGDTRPQNMDPMLKADHREKSRKDTTEVAKGKRFGKKEAAHRARLAAKNTLIWDSKTANWAEPEGEALEELQRLRSETKTAPKAKIKSPGFQKGHRPLKSRGFQKTGEVVGRS